MKYKGSKQRLMKQINPIFNSYKEKISYDDFWKWVRKISKDNIVLISELEAPDDFEVIWEKEISHGQIEKLRKTEKLFIYKGK